MSPTSEGKGRGGPAQDQCLEESHFCALERDEEGVELNGRIHPWGRGFKAAQVIVGQELVKFL